MDKILAIAVLLIFVWWAIPRLAQGQWIAPTATMPDPGSAGFGWFHFDFWNTPTLAGEPVTTSDLRLRSPKNEFQR